jgi:hypothetical protein
MLRRILRLFDAVLPLGMVWLCLAVAFAPAPTKGVFQLLLATDDGDPLEEDEDTTEEPFETASVSRRLPLRPDPRASTAALVVDDSRSGPAANRGICSQTPAGAAGEMLARNGCGAILRC